MESSTGLDRFLRTGLRCARDWIGLGDGSGTQKRERCCSESGMNVFGGEAEAGGVWFWGGKVFGVRKAEAVGSTAQHRRRFGKCY